MSNPFIGQITMFGGNFAPRGWAFCDGQLQAISSNTALFSILGTTYGGDGRTTFALPDLRGRVPIGPRSGPGLSTYREGQKGGVERVTLTPTQIPSHTHNQRGKAGAGDETNPGAGAFVATSSTDLYAEDADVVMGSTSNAGGGLDHANMQPFLSINFIIALVGTFPSRP